MYPNIESLNLRPDDRNFKFDRKFQGYCPEQVDEKIDELYKKINDLTEQNTSMNNAIGEFDEKIRALAENTDKLQQERVQESLRLANVLTNAGKAAEETMENAQLQAERILANARYEAQKITDIANSEVDAIKEQVKIDITAVREMLIGVEQSLREYS